MRVFIIFSILAAVSAENLEFNYLPVGRFENVTPLSPSQTNAALYDEIVEVSAPQDTAPPPSPTTQREQYEKEFFSFSAPEEAFDDIEGRENIDSILKKNLRVLFIRAPESKGLEKAALDLIEHYNQDHTAIYVLTKQTDVGSLAQQFEAVKSKTQSQPEVHFVKYRTPEDATYAQQAIQAQYNTLPGENRSVNGDVANVLDFATTSNPTLAPVVTSPTPTKAYLPPSLRRRFRSAKQTTNVKK